MDQPGDGTPVFKKNLIKPWRKLMWCIGRLIEEYRNRMYELLRLYEQDYCPSEPVVCIDEKSKQLIKDSRQSLAPKPGTPMRQDYEYVRAGTYNLFVAVEPKGGQRTVEITERRTKAEFVGFVRHLVERVYAEARCIHLVRDNLNAQARSSKLHEISFLATQKKLPGFLNRLQ